MELKSIITQGTTRSVFRIAHLSDTHISPEYNRQNIAKLKNLLAYIVDEGYDHVVITGDIAGHGEERDFRSVRRLLKSFDLLDYEKLSVTIGNHDIFGGVHRAEDLFSFGNHCRTTVYREKVELFERTFKETFPRKAYAGGKLFPFVKIVGPLAIIGINSVREFHPFLNPFGSNGYVSYEQLESVEKILNHPSLSDLRKVILIHHHFNEYQPDAKSLMNRLYYAFESRTLKLHGRKRVEDLFRNSGVEVVLHGHTHIEDVYTNSRIAYSSTALNTIKSKWNSKGDDLSKVSFGDGQLLFNEISVADDGGIQIKKQRIKTRSKGNSSRSFDKKFCEE